MSTPIIHFVRVFTNGDGQFGDIASIVMDEGRHIPDAQRKVLARRLNTGETIFVNDITLADISVVHPQGEIGFAGVGVLAAAWFLSQQQDRPLDALSTRDGKIVFTSEAGITWVRADTSILPPWNYKQLEDAEAVEQIGLLETTGWLHTVTWAWMDEAKGLIRARTFATDWEIPEAQGNGSGAMILAAQLGRSIEILHGEGAVIFAKPAENGQADIGGRVVFDKY